MRYSPKRQRSFWQNGTVDRVLGWKRGEDPIYFDWNITPAIFRTAEEIDRDFVYNDFCGANSLEVPDKGDQSARTAKVLVFLKPCDTYSFNQLLTEHRFDREKVYGRRRSL